MTTDVTHEKREALHNALAKRDTRCAERDEAKAALARAENVLRAVEAETEKHDRASNLASTDHASRIAAEIKAGKAPSIAVPENLQSAGHALADAKARRAVALAARDQLQKELSAAEARAKAAETEADAAAINIIVGESQVLAAEAHAALKRLVEIGDQLHGTASLWRPDRQKLIDLPPTVQAAVTRLRDAASIIDPSREQRALSQQSAQAYAIAHVQAWRVALLGDPDKRLADIPTPVLPGKFDHMPAIVDDLLEHKNPSHFGKLGARPKPTDQPNGAAGGEGRFMEGFGMRRAPDRYEKG